MSRIQYVSNAKIAPVIVIVSRAVLLTYANGIAAEEEQETQSCTSVVVESCKEAQFITDTKAAEWLEFRNLMQQWRNERGAQSSVAEMAMLPAYQKIIGMGEAVLPMILAELKAEGNTPDHWFWALAAIAHDNPVPPKSRGKMSEMAKAWLEWGQKEGHV